MQELPALTFVFISCKQTRQFTSHQNYERIKEN